MKIKHVHSMRPSNNRFPKKSIAHTKKVSISFCYLWRTVKRPRVLSFILGRSPLQSKSFNWWASYKNQRKWSIISSLLLADLDSLFSLPYIFLLFLSSFFSPLLLISSYWHPLHHFSPSICPSFVCLLPLCSVSVLSQPPFFSFFLSVS